MPFEIARNDITQMTVDAIANTADSNLTFFTVYPKKLPGTIPDWA